MGVMGSSHTEKGNVGRVDRGATWFFSSYGGILELRREFRLPLVLAQASPIFHSSCEGKLGIALE